MRFKLYYNCNMKKTSLVVNNKTYQVNENNTLTTTLNFNTDTDKLCFNNILKLAKEELQPQSKKFKIGLLKYKFGFLNYIVSVFILKQLIKQVSTFVFSFQLLDTLGKR